MIKLSNSSEKSLASWIALLEVSKKLPDHWTLVGGQMVHLLCAERGVWPMRPTDDTDAALDVRGRPDILEAFTKELYDAGLRIVTTTPDGHQPHWANLQTNAQIDLLIPTNLGDRASSRQGFSGGTTISSPGTQQALNRSQRVDVELVNGLVGQVNRPNLLGALVVKAAAWSADTMNNDRHLLDFVTLSGLIRTPEDLKGMTKRDASRLEKILADVFNKPQVIVDKSVETKLRFLSDHIKRCHAFGKFSETIQSGPRDISVPMSETLGASITPLDTLRGPADRDRSKILPKNDSGRGVRD